MDGWTDRWMDGMMESQKPCPSAFRRKGRGQKTTTTKKKKKKKKKKNVYERFSLLGNMNMKV